MDETENHILTLTNRESLSLTGINDVDAFNEEQIDAVTSFGDLTVKGELLHVEELNLDKGEMKISGKVTALVYTQRTASFKGLKRLFGG